MSIDERIMMERQRIASDGEPLFSNHRKVRSVGSGNELIQNIPETAVELLDIEESDTAIIDIYSDGYAVRFES